MSEPLIRPSRVKHFANIGDIIASLAGLKGYYERTERQIIFCQQLNVRADYYVGATHPTKHEGEMVMCNQKMYDMIRPLLMSQEYIKDVEVFTGQPINFDLDVIRKEVHVNMPHQAIQQWIFLAYPDLAADLSKAWIDIGEVDISDCVISYRSLLTDYLQLPDLSDKVIINFTERYRNAHVNYFFLKKYKDILLFAGTENEHILFCDQWGLDIPRIIVKDFLQLAFILKKAKFLLSNQSFQWNLSMAMKTPHILELCDHAPNCQCFFYKKSLGFNKQGGVQWYFKELLK